MVTKNTDLGPNFKIPGIYAQIQIGSAGAGDPNEPTTVLLLGEMLATGSWAPGGVYPLSSEQEVIDGAGRASTIHRQFRAAVAEVGEGNVRLVAAPVLEPSGGVVATYKLSVNILDGNMTTTANPTKPGTLRLQVVGDEISVGFGTSDTNSTIAAALYAELQKLKNVPCTFGISSEVITLTYNIKGLVGEDLPLWYDVTAGSGVWLGPGTLTFANNVTGAGSIKIACGTQSCSIATSGGETPTNAALLVRPASGIQPLAADDYPLLAVTPTIGAVPLVYRPRRTVRRVNVSIVTSTVVTATLSGGSATDGTGSASSTTNNGTVGSGLPTITTLLANVSKAGSFGEWTAPWLSSGSSSTGLTAIVQQIEADGNGVSQKNQHVTVGSVDAETVAAAVLGSTSPALSTTPRFTVGWCPDAGQQAYELAARRAAMFASWITPATNSDAAFGGKRFLTRQGTPLNFPDQRVRPSDATINAAIIDGLEPWSVFNNTEMAVIRGRNTFATTEQVLWDPSDIRQRGAARRRLRSDGSVTFAGAKVKADGIVNQPGEITTASVEGWAIGEITQFEKEGFYDGADLLKGAVKAEIDPADRSKINLQVPESPVPMLHQLGIVLARSAVSL